MKKRLGPLSNRYFDLGKKEELEGKRVEDKEGLRKCLSLSLSHTACARVHFCLAYHLLEMYSSNSSKLKSNSLMQLQEKKFTRCVIANITIREILQ